MTAHAFLRRVHRVIATFFLPSIPPAAVSSGAGGDPSPADFFPLFPLLGLTLTGTYLLVRPRTQWLRARRVQSLESVFAEVLAENSLRFATDIGGVVSSLVAILGVVAVLDPYPDRSIPFLY